MGKIWHSLAYKNVLTLQLHPSIPVIFLSHSFQATALQEASLSLSSAICPEAKTSLT